ncbi:MAG: DUF2812 domain-containing protein [Lachnospiraceae bacterium]|nr:DUF2812 domain-containing protein [Lachnospiraceae bacterium]
MKMKKRCINTFLFYDYDQVTAHLERMARKGWLLCKITKLFWEYQRIESADICFAVSYFPEASALEPCPGEQLREYWDYCEAAGWKLAAEWEQMQIMYSTDKKPIPLETDEQIKLEMIHRGMKKAWIPGMLALLVLNLLQFVRLFPKNVNWFYTDAGWVALLAAALFSAGLMSSLAGYFRWYRRSSKEVELGGACAKTGRCRWLTRSFLWLTFATLLWEYVILFREMLWITLFFLGIAALLMAGVCGLVRGFRWLGMTRNANLICTAVVGVVIISLAMNGFGAWMSQYTVRVHDREEIVNADELLLTVEDLKEPDYTALEPNYELEQGHSIFMNWEQGKQYAAQRDDSFDKIEYRTYEIKQSWMYDYFLRWITGETDLKNSDWRPINSGRWAVEEIYQYQFGAEVGRLYEEVYVVTEGGRIIWLGIDWLTTEDELTLALAKMGIVRVQDH